MKQNQKIKIGSVWTIEHWRGKRLLRRLIEQNLIPNQFINHVLDVALSGGTSVATWYIALFSNNHTPASGNTYATPGYTESTAYDEVARPAWAEAGVTDQEISNEATKADFTMTGVDATIYGAALVSSATKGNTAATGAILGPVAQFTAGAVSGIVDNDILKVYVTITGTDAT